MTTSAATVGRHTSTSEPSGSGGLPQFEFQHWAGQIGYLLILFAILYLLMARVFAPRVRRVFDERTRVINEALTSARSVQAAANAQAAAARDAVADARAQAQRTAAEAKAKAAEQARARQAELEAELAGKLSQAEARIGSSRDAAMTNVSSIAADTAQAIVEKLTGSATDRQTVDVAMAKVRG